MNSARQRREKIRYKARLSMIKRVAAERLNNKKKDWNADSSARQKTRWARVYLKTDQTMESFFTTSVAMQFPIECMTETITAMQKNGFWAVRPHDNELLFVMPGQIVQVRVELDDGV